MMESIDNFLPPPKASDIKSVKLYHQNQIHASELVGA